MAEALSAAIATEDWQELLDAYIRCMRITRSQRETLPALTLPAEHWPSVKYQQVTTKQNGNAYLM